MRIKKLILLLSIILLCGCSAEVTLDVDENTIDEKITFTNVDYTPRKYYQAFKGEDILDEEPDTKKENVEYYTYKNDGNSYIYEYKYNIEDFSKSNSIYYGFKYIGIYKDTYENNITLTIPSNGTTYFDSNPTLEEIKLNIHTDLEVTYNNADYVDEANKIYTWIINKENNTTSSKSISIQYAEAPTKSYEELKKEEEEKEKEEEENKEKEQTEEEKMLKKSTILAITIAVFVYFVIIFVAIKRKRNEEK